MKYPLLIVAIVLLLLFGPILSIWALNALFPMLVIPYTVKTWCAMLMLGGIFRGSTK